MVAQERRISRSPFGAPGGHLSQNATRSVGTRCDALEGKGDTLQSMMQEGFGIVLDALRDKVVPSHETTPTSLTWSVAAPP